MPSRSLGSTGLVVSRLGLGLAALGLPAYINLGRSEDFGHERSVADLQRRCHDMLNAAYAAGIRYVDAARSYGMAEAFLGAWLSDRNLPDDAITIGSKWGYSYVGAWRLDASVHEVKDLSVDTLRRQIAESRALLGHRLHLYQIHSATGESGVLDDVAVLRELQHLRSGGLVIGLTVSGPRQADVIRRALRTNVDGRNPFQVVQATWNLLEGSAGTALADANARGTTVDALALAAALSQPWADVVLSGAVTVEQLHSNVKSIGLAREAADWPAIAEPTAEYWVRRSALAWQ